MSKLIENAVNEISKIPGLGKRSAFKIVLFLLKQPLNYSKSLSNAILDLKQKVCFCEICKNISDTSRCFICLNEKRDKNKICIVENFQDIIAIESTDQYLGLYHVLNGLISPINGIGPNDININSLINRIKDKKIKEVIFALSNTDEGETTAFYIKKKLQSFAINITIISRGISAGEEIEYIDSLTLGRSIIERIPYNIN